MCSKNNSNHVEQHISAIISTALPSPLQPPLHQKISALLIFGG